MLKKVFLNKWLWLVLGATLVLLFSQKGKEVKKTVIRGGFNFASDVKGRENLEKLKQGCPFKDCIPAIDDPSFESIAEADEWLEDDDVVFALDLNGEQRVYPQKIMNWHEIVNDEVGEVKLAITFCPLCGSALAFNRVVDGKVLSFGVSGKLHNSDLVMYDRETESLWQQITGEGIVGEMFGVKLKQISMDSLRWVSWKNVYPSGRVLSRDTGYSRDYSRYPYGSYEQDESVLFPLEGEVDKAVHPKTVVYGLSVNGTSKAYTLEALERDSRETGVVNDVVGGEKIRLSFSQGGVFVENLRTKEEIVTTRSFWFAWKAFHSKSELYD